MNKTLLAIGIWLALVSAGFAQVAITGSAGPNRPATVPANYLVTPFGYFHPDCVLQLPSGSKVRRDLGVIQHPNGTYSKPLPACAYPQYTRKGEEVTGGQSPAQQPSATGWIEWASTCLSSASPLGTNCDVSNTPAYGDMVGYWTVPEEPTASDGFGYEVLFFWFGMEDWQVGNDVIQPVLAWNRDFYHAWSIASWNCCMAGYVWEATPVRVHEGDSISGHISPLCAPGYGTVCADWGIDIVDQTLNSGSVLGVTRSYGETFNWAMVVMEVYNVTSCDNYPRGDLTFENLTLRDEKGNLVNPAWTFVVPGTYGSATLHPQCGYSVSVAQAVPTSPFTYGGAIRPGGMQVTLRYAP